MKQVQYEATLDTGTTMQQQGSKRLRRTYMTNYDDDDYNGISYSWRYKVLTERL